MKWREGQKEVMKYKAGVLAVPSVPGAGKTTVITAKTAELISEGVNKDGKVLIVTFTNSAVSNFKAKLKKLLEDKNINSNKGWECKTLHSLANSIIKESPKHANLDEEFEVLTEIECIEIIRNHYLNIYNSGNNKEFITNMLNDSKPMSHEEFVKVEKQWNDRFISIVKNMIGIIKSMNVDYVKVQAVLRSGADINNIMKIILNLFVLYEKELIIRGKIDYNDIIVRGYNLLEGNEEILAEFQSIYSFVFEDEAQDSSVMQERILGLISKGNNNLVRVGDPNQAIMATFTNSDFRLFKSFLRERRYKKNSYSCKQP